MTIRRALLVAAMVACAVMQARALAEDTGVVAAKPLYRDPVYDGAADPVVVWNREGKRWVMFYTNRRANVPGLAGVSWVHGTRIGMAESRDGGGTWKYAGMAKIGYGRDGEDTYWAPDVVYDGGVYHMFVTFVPGIPKDWNAERRIVHLKSWDLVNWGEAEEIKLASDRVIDASVCRLPDGTWGMWYNDERDHKSIRWARSTDLGAWEDVGKVVGDRAGEGPKVFVWKGKYWMVVDHWRGLGVYRAEDGVKWEKQEGMLLDVPGTGEDDQVMGNHCDVVVSGGRAWMFYFTHPGRRGPDARKDGVEQRRSSIQVVELEVREGKLMCDRDRAVRVELRAPVHEAGAGDVSQSP